MVSATVKIGFMSEPIFTTFRAGKQRKRKARKGKGNQGKREELDVTRVEIIML